MLAPLFEGIANAELVRFLGDGVLAADGAEGLPALAVSIDFAPIGWGLALGVVAMYLLAAVEATSLVMKRMPRRWWRCWAAPR